MLTLNSTRDFVNAPNTTRVSLADGPVVF